MSRTNDPPFQRGETFNGHESDVLTDASAGENFEGKEYVFEDNPVRSLYEDEDPRITGFPVTCRIVRNVSGVNLQGKRLVDLKVAGHYGRRAAGYARVTADKFVAPSDEYLPAAGVRNNDLFYVVTRGPAIFKTSNAEDETNVINEGDRLVSLTAALTAATTGTTGGKIRSALAATTNDAAAINGAIAEQHNAIGTALSARTTAQTDTDILVLVGY